MLRVPQFLSSFAFVLVFLSCRQNRNADEGTEIQLKIQAGYHLKIYLRQMPFNGGHFINIDSAVPQYGVDSFLLHIPKGEEGLFMLTVAGTNVQLPLINDSKHIDVYYNYATRKYIVDHSPATTELKTFEDGQFRIATGMRALKRRIDSLKREHATPYAIEDSVKKLDSINIFFLRQYKNFADTVHSPAAFMAVFNAIDFGDDRSALKTFIMHAAARFPNHSGVQTFAQNVLDYLKIFDTQYKIGDTLPELVLPDQYGFHFSTYSLKGRYVLINIWSTLCDACVTYSDAIKRLKKEFADTTFEAVNIALDDEQQEWLRTISERNYNWPQLIDKEMWNGKTFKTLRFDSIPYNFLISPSGVLIKKGIKADSIETVIKQSVTGK